MIGIIGLMGGAYMLFRCMEVMITVGASKDIQEGKKTFVITVGVLVLFAELYLMSALIRVGE